MTGETLVRRPVVHQLYRGGPEIYPVGDCNRTAWANLLGLADPRLVPHFVQLALDHFAHLHRYPPGWVDHMLVRQWLRSISHNLDACLFNPDHAAEFARTNDLTTLLGVTTVDGRRFDDLAHSIVWDIVAGECWADPSPTANSYPPYRPDELDGPFTMLCERRTLTPEAELEQWLANDGADEEVRIYFHPAAAFAEQAQHLERWHQ